VIVLTGLKCPVRCVTFSPDGMMPAAGGEDCVIRLWDASAGAHRGTLAVATVDPADVTYRFAPDGRHPRRGG